MKVTLEDSAILDKVVDKLKEVERHMDEIEKKAITIHTITPKQLAEIMDWSQKTAYDCFNRPDFPACDYGREKRAEINAVINYFSVPRLRDA